MSTAIEVAQEYFARSNARDLTALEGMISDSTTYSSVHTDVYLGRKQIMEMKRTFYGSFVELHWDVHTVEEVRPGVLLFDFTFHGTKNDGEVVERPGLEYVIVHEGKLQHIEVRNRQYERTTNTFVDETICDMELLENIRQFYVEEEERERGVVGIEFELLQRMKLIKLQWLHVCSIVI